EATACFELPFDKELNTTKEELAKFRKIAMADAEVVSNREVRIKRGGSPVGNSIAFGADIKLVCALNNGAYFSFSLDGFRTEIWDRDLKRRLAPPINEWMLFTGHDTPQKTTDVSLSQDGSRAVVRSTIWIPPNVGIFWASVWDVASG